MNKFILLIGLFFAHPVLATTEEAIFAGGNFWRLESEFNKLQGVLATVTGFDGGTTKNPTYAEVNAGITEYTQSLRVIYNPHVITYQEIVNYFWHQIDPTVKDSQFCDTGKQYRTAIFYLNPHQKKIALASKKRMQQQFEKIYTVIKPSTQFYAADGNNQNYFQKHPLRYNYYLQRCRQQARLRELWKNTTKKPFIDQ